MFPVASQGHSIDEALEHLKEALRSYSKAQCKLLWNQVRNRLIQPIKVVSFNATKNKLYSVSMASKDDLKRVYLDTSVILPFFENLMKNKTETTGFIEFLIRHPEIEKWISSFTIAELVEHLFYKTPEVKQFMKNLKNIEAFVKTFQQMVPNLNIILLEESKKGNKGLIIAVPQLINYTSLIGNVQDAVHVCIAMHEDLWIVTKDDKIGKVKELYPKTIGMVGFMKAFE